MESKNIIILFNVSLIIGTTLAVNGMVNGSYCCTNPNEEIRSYEDGNRCVDMESNATTTVELTCPVELTKLLTNNSDFPVELNSEGRLVLMLGDVPDDWPSLAQGEFCLGHHTENGTLEPSVVLLCLDKEPEVLSMVYCMAISSVFLALTAVMYLALSELRDLQGKSIISFCISLATANILMCIMKVMEYSDMNWCAFRGFLTYFFIVSSFFWMNAIAIEILRSIKRSSIYSYGIREFVWYSLYAWGMPALLTAILVIINYHPGHHKKPGIGHQHCWFLDIKRMWIYMYSVLSILMAANVFIFVYTSVYLWKFTFSSNHIRAMRYKFGMMFRMFIMMGLPWIFEMVSSLAPTHVVWVIIDISNCLQGIVIFLILVVFRRRVIKALHKRNALCCLTGVAERYLALGADDEDDIVTHTIAVPLEEKLST